MLLAGVAVRGTSKGIIKLAEKFPKVAQDMVKMSINTRKIVDDSKFGKMAADISKKYTKFKTNHKGLMGFVSKNAFPITLVSYFLASVGLSAAVQEKKFKIASKTAQEMCESKYSLNTVNA